jgi:hypothetical protein
MDAPMEQALARGSAATDQAANPDLEHTRGPVPE